MRSTLRRGAVVAAGAAILSLAFGSAAAADPQWLNDGTNNPNSFVPDSNDVVGVGSDTSQYVMNSAAIDITDLTEANRVASFNACNPLNPAQCGAPTIVPESGSAPVTRPNGSSQGISRLLADDTDGGLNLFDFARSSRGPQGTEGNELYFIPALNDGLSYAVANTTNVPLNLTTADLTALYRCDDPTSTLNPLLPQTGSGTRQFFLQSIGLSDTTIGDCVTNVQEHDPAPIAADPNALAPFSTARWQVNPPDEANPPSATTQIANLNGGGSTFFATREIYNAVHKDEFDGNVNGIADIFGPGGEVCTYFEDPLNLQGFTAHDTCGEPINP
jgi:ABC-type phosphate transport system substrate-binding protein